MDLLRGCGGYFAFAVAWFILWFTVFSLALGASPWALAKYAFQP